MKARKDEKIVIAEIAFEQLKRDNAAFTAYSPIYDSDFNTKFENEIKKAKAVVNTENLIAEGKVLTETLYSDVDKLKVHINKFEGYVKRADNLTINVKDFGIHEVREKINNKDAEGLVMKLSTLIVNITKNTVALEKVGYTTASFTELKSLQTKINNDNVGQTMQDENQSETVVENNKIIERLDLITKDVLDAGKRIYRFSNDVKYGEYIYQKLLRKVRHERNVIKTELNKINENCIVYINCVDGDDVGIEGLSVKIEEYALSLETDEDGIAYFESVPTKPKISVTITIEGEGWTKQTLANQKLTAGGDLNLDVVMKAIE
jgi:hypothetical protein